MFTKRMFVFIVVLFGCFTWTVSLSRSGQKVDLNAFTKRQNELLMKKQREYQSHIQSMKDQSLVEEFSSDERESGTTRSGAIPNCDCDDTSDPYNNKTTNFLYDVQGNKTYRITPYCKCRASTASSSSYIGVSKESTKTKESEGTYKWDIQY